MAGIIPINNELSIYHHTCSARDFTRTLLALGGIAVLPAHRLAAQNTPAQAAPQYPVYLERRPHLAVVGHLRRAPRPVRPEPSYPPACRRGSGTRQLLLHQLHLGAQPGIHPHRAL